MRCGLCARTRASLQLQCSVLALDIRANTTLFSVVNGVLLNPLPLTGARATAITSLEMLDPCFGIRVLDLCLDRYR
jgi:hypothetical protein